MKMDDQLVLKLKNILETQSLSAHRAAIGDLVKELQIDALECAAALLYWVNSIEPPVSEKDISLVDDEAVNVPSINPPARMVRYRLDVGRKQGLSKESLTDLLVEESGVERKMIGNPDIRLAFTLVELPEGMPEDIFQHLKCVEFNQHRLNIKRTGSSSRKKRHHNFKRSKQSSGQSQKSPVE
ncbi:DbpA RNA binding domain-containing protein [Methylicorpusculum oleiharenae]|uniref:DbpA RNA binding domain-containing protein n=1 Tax=Methylicorpusculum oleiharenae TaxID=1338687 RepID=UPI00135B24E3|nr:DbpA RNA binding domain-containing protein [Methylicorpusculum oleiharenae]MCD2449654.1 DbpA RNA binding domain-containing protein [Methylicorpusculum oleiharenae]